MICMLSVESDFHGPMFGSSVVEFKERYLKNLNSRDDSIGPGWVVHM